MGNVGQSSVSLAYDASGNMIEQTNGSATTQIVYAPDGTKLALMNGTSALVKAFVPLTGGATAVYNSTGLAGYRHSDWLGSARLTSSSASPTQATSETAYGPFGEVYWSSGTPDPSFTGMNQDADPNSGIYDFPAREYEMEGRWPSPDPLGIGAVDPTDPQSWNRYAYVRNSPLSLTDPNGMDYYVCIGGSYGYVGSNQQGQCRDYGGDTITDLDAALPTDLWALGDNNSGSILSTGDDYGAGFIGTYYYENGGGGGGGGGDNGNDDNSSGGGLTSAQQQILKNCISQLFGVGTLSFRPSTPGHNGSFTGVMAGIYNGIGQPLLPGPSGFSVTNDVSKNEGALTSTYALNGGQLTMGTLVDGLTLQGHPFLNYTASNSPTMTSTQIWELGNSLALVTGQLMLPSFNTSIGPQNTEPGKKLTDCYQGGQQ